MRVSWNWLGDLVELAGTPAEVAARLTMAGLEVEGIHDVGGSFSGVVVAEVRGKQPHPTSAKLTIVSVSDGNGVAEVVCGAPNVPEPDARVLWARPGSRLPDGREIAKRAVAGVESPGMLCSEVELGLGEESGGIIVLAGEDATAAPGTTAQDALGLRDTILDVNIHANRPDCLGHLGIAREIAALHGWGRRPPPVALEAFTGERATAEMISVEIRDPALCPRYTARVIKGLKIGPSPRWMRRRLEAVGARPINNLVDVTNYVMFELGHPLHAFDLEELHSAAIVVRAAEAGERITTLDQQPRELLAGDLVIADARGPVALAGVMGGHGTQVTGTTTRVLLEAATFAPKSIRRTARRLGLTSESSYRFERGVDANGVDFASARAARLLGELGGGRATRGLVDVYPRKVAPLIIDIRPRRAEMLLGVELDGNEIARCLRSLEIGVTDGVTSLHVTVPTFRPDLEREVDLIEEVARVHGFDDIPATLPGGPAGLRPTVGDTERSSLREDGVRRALAAAGVDETISYGFTSPARVAALRFPAEHPVSRPLAVKNPMREEQAVMRTSLLCNLLAAVAHNQSFGQHDVRLFEIGSVFLRGAAQLPNEPRLVAAVISGERTGWLKSSGTLDFFDVKGLVERLLSELRLAAEIVPARREDGFLHPGVAASVLVEGAHVGVLGEVHPQTRDSFGLERACFAFELSLEQLPLAPPAQLRPIGRFPAILRDVSFFVDDFVSAAQVLRVIDADRPALLEDVRVVEDYREPGKVPPGKKGMLWSMTYRDSARTLTDQEVDASHEQLVARLLKELKAERR